MDSERLTACSDALHEVARELERQDVFFVRLLAFDVRFLADSLSDLAKKEAAAMKE